MQIKKIHHINFLVRDLDSAINRYRELFDVEQFVVESLPGRGVKTARFALGEQWVVLVQPTDPEGVPGQHLHKHGEGFFLISYAVADLDKAAQRIKSHGGEMMHAQPRKGLEDWAIWDIGVKETFGVQTQICEQGYSW